MKKIDPQLVHGFVLGVFFTVLFTLASLKVKDQFSEPEPTVDPAIVIQAYNAGKKDALRTNPVSMELDMVCLNLWINKQPNQE